MEAMLLAQVHVPPILHFPCSYNIVTRMGCRPLHATAASSPWFPFRHSGKKRVDESISLTLDRNRNTLIRQEDSIIFSFLERAQYSYTTDAYNHDALFKDGFHGSLVEYMVWETEKLHAQMGRYKSPDEHVFFPAYLPEPILPPLQYPQVWNSICFHVTSDNS